MKWMQWCWVVAMAGGLPVVAQAEVTPPTPVPEMALPAVLDSEAIENPEQAKETDMVLIKTTKGDITVKLAADKAPLTVANFLAYVDAGHYDGTIFHRVIDGFMIQGGGFDANMRQKPTKAPVKNEAANGLLNQRGTLAMARTMVVDSATSQFFINVTDNAFLNFTAPTPQGHGYCVFGEVVEGLDVVDQIKGVRTGVKAGMSDVPLETVEILSVTRVD